MATRKIDLIYQNDDFVAVNKPDGVSVTKDRDGSPGIIELARQVADWEGDMKIVQRLDKQTHGITIISKNEEFHKAFAESINQNSSSVVYLALINGYVPADTGRIKMPIGRGKDLGTVKIDPRKGKQAVTYWQKLADFGTYSLLAVRPVTDKTHQVRVHLKHRGMPLAIDPVYGNPNPVYLSEIKPGYRTGKNREEERPLIEKMTLHAYEIVFKDELTDIKEVAAKPDKKFIATIKMLNKHCRVRGESFRNIENLEEIINGLPLSGLEILEFEGRADEYSDCDD